MYKNRTKTLRTKIVFLRKSKLKFLKQKSFASSVTNSPAKTKFKTRQVFKELEKKITGHAYGLRLSTNEQQQQNLNANRGQ